MKNYVVTGFDEKYWDLWGMSWLISLQEIAKHNAEDIIVLGFDLSSNTKNKILDTGVNLLPGIFSGRNANPDASISGDIRFDTMRMISDLSKKESAIFAYWDADSFFQDDISEIFKLAEFDLVSSFNRSKGFFAGPSIEWIRLRDVLNILTFMDNKVGLHETLINHFGKFILNVDNTWNFTDIPGLKDVDGKLAYKGEVQKVIHPTGQIKLTLKNRNLCFWERHKDLYQSFDRKKTGFRKLIAK